MPYQCVREPLTAEEADRLANACATPTEQRGAEGIGRVVGAHARALGFVGHNVARP
jgi:hypothetical protein